jgi:hypothetical protein
VETLQTWSTVLGLGFLTGIRLYATVLAVGVIVRMHWFTLPAAVSNLNVLAEPWVMVAAAVGCAAEFLADKVPWVDSVWDSFHTIIRPVGAALIGTQILSDMDPATNMALALMCGGVAFAGHSTKAATRLIVNHSPEPFTNVALSVAEDLMVPVGLWLMWQHPLVSCVLIGVFLAAFCWLAPKLFRILHVEWIALRSLVSRYFGGRSETPISAASGPVARAIEERLSPLPDRYAEALQARNGRQTSAGVLCTASRNVPGLKNSIGYLCFFPDRTAFVAKRFFRYRVFEIPAHSRATVTSGLLFDTFRFDSDRGPIEFDAFKARKPARASERPALSHS